MLAVSAMQCTNYPVYKLTSELQADPESELIFYYINEEMEFRMDVT
jgi:hypothetical protein